MEPSQQVTVKQDRREKREREASLGFLHHRTTSCPELVWDPEETRASKERKETEERTVLPGDQGSQEDQDLWDQKESQWWVLRGLLGCQVHQVFQVMADKDQLVHLDHQAHQDFQGQHPDTAQL